MTKPILLSILLLAGAAVTNVAGAGKSTARGYDPATAELAFEFLDATGLPNAKAAHMHNATFHFTDNDHFSSSWQMYQNGEPSQTEHLEYTRVK